MRVHVTLAKGPSSGCFVGTFERPGRPSRARELQSRAVGGADQRGLTSVVVKQVYITSSEGPPSGLSWNGDQEVVTPAVGAATPSRPLQMVPDWFPCWSYLLARPLIGRIHSTKDSP